MKYTFFFDYFYYRITKAYFKWDGRTGGTAIAAISMFQMFILIDVFALSTRTIFDRYFFKPYVQQVTVVFCLLIAIIVVINYKKYVGSYNQFKIHWKDESSDKQTFKAVLIVLSYLLLLAPLILMTVLS